MNTRGRWARVVVALGVIGASAGCAKADRGAAPASTAAQGPAPKDQASPAPGSMREVHVELRVQLASDDGARGAFTRLEGVTREAGGFVQLASFGNDASESHLVLRVPPAAMPRLREACVAAGAIVRDDETTIDVTDAIADRDARLRAARTEETRLLALVEQRTGSVADVLAAERALADVRDRIERLDAESRAAHGRVDLATADVWIVHPTATTSEGSIVTRLEAAATDGAHAAGSVSLAIATTSLRAGPSALVLGALAAAMIALVRRWRGRRVVASAS